MKDNNEDGIFARGNQKAQIKSWTSVLYFYLFFHIYFKSITSVHINTDTQDSSI